MFRFASFFHVEIIAERGRLLPAELVPLIASDQMGSTTHLYSGTKVCFDVVSHRMINKKRTPFLCPLVGVLPTSLGPIPSSVAILENLEWLNLSENVLTGPVPGSLSGLTRLAELNLSSNGLTGPLPPEICSMASLVSLQLSRNALEGCLPTEVCDAQHSPSGLISVNSLFWTIWFGLVGVLVWRHVGIRTTC